MRNLLRYRPLTVDGIRLNIVVNTGQVCPRGVLGDRGSLLPGAGGGGLGKRCHGHLAAHLLVVVLGRSIGNLNVIGDITTKEASQVPGTELTRVPITAGRAEGTGLTAWVLKKVKCTK